MAGREGAWRRSEVEAASILDSGIELMARDVIRRRQLLHTWDARYYSAANATFVPLLPTVIKDRPGMADEINGWLVGGVGRA